MQQRTADEFELEAATEEGIDDVLEDEEELEDDDGGLLETGLGLRLPHVAAHVEASRGKVRGGHVPFPSSGPQV